MIEEKSCVDRFITKSQVDFKNGMSLSQVLSQTDHYQKLVRRYYGHHSFFSRPAHRIGTSKVGLSFLATYEYLRYKGMPLPDANEMIKPFLPLRDLRRALCNGKKPAIDRQELITFEL